MELATAKRAAVAALLVFDLAALAEPAMAKPRLSDATIKRRIIAASIDKRVQ